MKTLNTTSQAWDGLIVASLTDKALLRGKADPKKVFVLALDNYIATRDQVEALAGDLGLHTSGGTVYKTFAYHFIALGRGYIQPRHRNCGLCEEVKQFLVTQDLILSQVDYFKWLVDELMTTWPLYSGRQAYPVPSEGLDPKYAYVETKDFWIGEYGKLRKQLCTFIGNSLLKEIYK